MESKELLYTPYRVRELERLLPEGLTGAELQQVEALVQGRDEVGLITLRERLPLSRENRERLRIIAEARPVALKIVALWREMPLRHEEIEAHYKQLKQLKAEYDRVAPRRGRAPFY